MSCLTTFDRERPAGMTSAVLNTYRQGLKLVGKKNEGMIQLGWNIEAKNDSLQHGRRTFKQNNCSSDNLVKEAENTHEGTCAQLTMQRKKRSGITETIRSRMYGAPGHNIFTYELDKPRPCRMVPENLDVGMIPKEDGTATTKKLACKNTKLDSLDVSLLPKGEPTKKMTKKISPKTNESHIDQGFMANDEALVKTTKLSPLKYATNLEPGLLPVSERRGRSRRHFSSMNTHCYDFLKGNE